MILSQFLEASRATPAFREAVSQFLRDGKPNDRVTFDRYSPPIKVERTLTKVLESYGDLPIEWIRFDARSGCDFFRGVAVVCAPDTTREIAFEWNCRWRAEEEGWTDYFGFPDQTRAAREFGYDCFRVWEENGVHSS